MPTVTTAAGTRIYLQSAIATAVPITAITKADPGVVSYTGTDPTTGDYVAFVNMEGMTELEDKLIKIGTVDTGGDSFPLTGTDKNTTNYGTWTDGDFQVVTLGTEIRIASGVNISGGDLQYADYQYLWDNITRQVPTVASPVSIDFECIWDLNDSGAQAMLAAYQTKSKLGVRVVFPNGVEMLAFGYIGFSGTPNASDANSIVTTQASIRTAGAPGYILA